MRDIVIPGALQDAMSREAQAAREKQARIILGQAELEIAASFAEAAKSYQDNPIALHLRAMNMLYEGLKEKGALMLIPSSAVESMGMGGMLGAAALRQQKLTRRTRNQVPGFQEFQMVPRVWFSIVLGLVLVLDLGAQEPRFADLLIGPNTTGAKARGCCVLRRRRDPRPKA